MIPPQLNSNYDTLGEWGASQVALVVKNLLANAGDIRDAGLIPGSGRSQIGRASCRERV